MGQFEIEKCNPGEVWGAWREESLILLWVFPAGIPPDSHCEEPKRSLCGFSKEKERVELQRKPSPLNSTLQGGRFYQRLI